MIIKYVNTYGITCIEGNNLNKLHVTKSSLKEIDLISHKYYTKLLRFDCNDSPLVI